jgi:SecD/SecF fusion protein
MTDRQRYGFVLVLVLGLMVASVVVLTQFPTRLGLDLKGGTQLVYQGTPTPQTPHVTQDALNRAVNIMRDRVDQLGVAEPEIQTSGDNEITVGLPDVQDTSRAEKLVGSTAQLDFYDWEANVLTPSGKPAANGLQTQDPTSVTLSQGAGSGPGFPGAGSVSLYDAVKLASKQPPVSSTNSSHLGNQYYMFGAPGSAACETAAKFYGVTPQVGQHCYLSGPDDSPADLASGLPPGVSASEGETLIVPPGTVVLQAADVSSSHQTQFFSPDAQFYVLKDNVSLTGNEITNPQQSTDTTGTPDVTFGFTSKGNSAFQTVTGDIAHRGELDSIGQTNLVQHFAVALDNKLITVPQIDYHTYPDGIIGGNGAEITGGFTTQSAQDLATQLRLGALPINLKLISESQVSATLGKQALHEGLLAGGIGLLVVALFLLFYYRILGMIAVAGLAVYALYFYALIKLIPVTLTLPGIAGLILTIGVAADANVVIFERVKEEIRGGRSIRQGIATGYRKGLTAIIDANVVTIMTAFILFVLATSEVQGFAFTLGIGTFVSLFTAVMATQAILMTMSGSRMIARPSALGAGGKKHVWKFDFMGASRYFFSMSGVILLVGALAIGARGLNLGIDFTSGTRITASLEHPATQAQVNSIMNAAGASNAQVRAEARDVQLDLGRPDVRQDRRQQRDRRDHRLAARDLGLRGFTVRVEVRDPSPDRLDARLVDHERRVRADRPGGDDSDRGRAADDLGLFALRHDHRLRPSSRERSANAPGCLLADRQPLDVRGADPVDRDDLLHADADPRAASVRRRRAQGLCVRAADRRRVRRLLLYLHRLAGAYALEGARAPVPRSPAADRGGARHRSAIRHRRRRRRARVEAGASGGTAHHARGRNRLGGRVRGDEARDRGGGARAPGPHLDAHQAPRAHPRNGNRAHAQAVPTYR